MLDSCPVNDTEERVVRLVSIAGPSARRALLDHGFDPDLVGDIVALLDLLGIALSPEELVADSFRPRDSLSGQFAVGRFGDGTIGVFYSALDQLTCQMELEYHLFARYVHDGLLPYERSYSLIHCSYSGETADLRGQEVHYPHLVSETDDGYPFCQALALAAIGRGISGFFTRSARNEHGTCLPVFLDSALSDPEIVSNVFVSVSDSGVVFRPHA